MSSAFLKPIASFLKEAFDNFLSQTKDTSALNGFLRSKGWLTSIPQSNVALIHTILDLKPQIESIIQYVKKVENMEDDIETLIADAVPIIKALVNDIKTFSSVLGSSQTIFPLTRDDFWDELADNLFDHIVVSYLEEKQKILYTVFCFIGIIEQQKIVPANMQGRIPYVKQNINWDNLIDFFSGPVSHIKTMYNWGGTTINYDLLFKVVQRIMNKYHMQTRLVPIGKSHYDNYFPGFNPGSQVVKMLDVPLYERWDNDGNDYRKVSVAIMPAPNPTNNTQLTGLLIVPMIAGASGFDFQLTPNLQFKGEGYFNTDNILGFYIYPNKLQLSTNVTNLDAGAKISLIAAPTRPWYLLGDPSGGTCLMLNGIETSLEVKGPINDPDLVFRIGGGKTVNEHNLKFVFAPGEGDGFIQKLMGNKSFELTSDFALKWSSKHGISFEGSADFYIEIPLHQDKGETANSSPLKIKVIRIGAGIGGGGTKIIFAIDFSVDLGFFSATIDNIGAQLNMVKKPSSEPGGILNNLDFKLGFKPPNGVGLKIKASVVEGGGYLYLDPDKGKYYGAFELKIAGKLTVSAVGIVTTKNPDGTPGFSMLLLLNVTFAPSIPIGFGFSISGVGGMIGVNRSMATEPLRLGVKTGAIDHIMFPENVIDNINAIITDLEQIFPMQQKRYTIGLFFLLGWGVPTPLIKIKLGVIVEIPSPVKLAIIGTISMKLPSEDKAVLQLNVAFAGIIDFDKKYLTFDASIYDSKILTFSLFGDMAVRVFWGEHREILISIGGFHPAYNPPAYLLLPAKMDRLTISIFNESNLKLQLATYFAVTSNTVQFGARLDFLFKVSKFQVVGIFGFDVLFQFNPFKFRTDVYASLAVKWGSRELMSLSLDFMLEGPGPWHAKGSASFKVLFIKCKVNFDKTWGPQPATSLPDVAVVPLISADLQKKENWVATLPDQKKLLVSIKELPATDIVLHPLGALSITQKIAPLGVKIERFGNQHPSDGGTYDITAVKIASITQNIDAVQDSFAPSQFRNMDDAQKLKASSFEYLKSGVQLKTMQTQDLYMDRYVLKNVQYDRILIDNVHYDKQRLSIKRAMLTNFIKGGLISANPISKQLRTDFNSPIVKAAAKQEEYKLVSKDSLKELSTITGSGIANTTSGSKASAFTLMEQLIQQQPGLAGKIQAVPVY